MDLRVDERQRLEDLVALEASARGHELGSGLLVGEVKCDRRVLGENLAVVDLEIVGRAIDAGEGDHEAVSLDGFDVDALRVHALIVVESRGPLIERKVRFQKSRLPGDQALPRSLRGESIQ